MAEKSFLLYLDCTEIVLSSIDLDLALGVFFGLMMKIKLKIRDVSSRRHFRFMYLPNRSVDCDRTGSLLSS